MWNRNARRLLTLLAVSFFLSGCATSSQLVTVPPPKLPPPPPELMVEPDLSETYSGLVRKLLSEWLKKLTDWKQQS